MKKVLKLDQAMKNFEGKTIVISEEDRSPVTLKAALLVYCRNAGLMGISGEEERVIYEVGLAIGEADGTVELTLPQWDALKKLADYGKAKTGEGQEVNIFGLEIKGQIKRLVDGAETRDN